MAEPPPRAADLQQEIIDETQKNSEAMQSLA
jgi:hypothetical protein